MILESNLEAMAANFAARSHKDQKRRYTLEPYIVHPMHVAKMVKAAGCSEEAIAAAWLHDVVEDCSVLPEEIAYKFGDGVAALVAGMTDPKDGNRAARKLAVIRKMHDASAELKTVKIADLIDNSESIIRHDPDFAKVFIKEKAALLVVLEGGDPALWKQAREIVQGYMQQKQARTEADEYAKRVRRGEY